MSRKKELQEKLVSLQGKAQAIIDAADKRAGVTRGGTLTKEEDGQVNGFLEEAQTVEDELKTLERQEGYRTRLQEREKFLNESPGRRADPNPVDPGTSRTDGQAIVLRYRGQDIRLEAGTPEHQRATPAYHKAFLAFLASGVSAGLMTGRDPKGGYLTSTQTSMELLQNLDDAVIMRQLATVLPPLTQATSLGIPTLDTDVADADWTVEIPASDMTEDDALAFGKRELIPHPGTKLIKISRKLLRAALLNPDTIARQRIAYKVGITQEKAFLTGDGNKKPLGVFTASNDGIPTTRDTSCVSQTEYTADELIDLKFSLKGQYQNNGSWLMHRDTVKRARKLKTGDGQYLWVMGLAGQPSTILDRPYYMSEYAPNTFTSGNYVAIFGDFKAGYWIVDSLSLAIDVLDQLFRLRNQVGLICEYEVDGAPVLAEAFGRLKLA